MRKFILLPLLCLSTLSNALAETPEEQNARSLERFRVVEKANQLAPAERISQILLDPEKAPTMSRPSGLTKVENDALEAYKAEYTTKFTNYYKGLRGRRNNDFFNPPLLPENLSRKLTTAYKAELSQYLARQADYVITYNSTLTSGISEGMSDKDFPTRPNFYDFLDVEAIRNSELPAQKMSMEGVSKLVVGRPDFTGKTEEEILNFYCRNAQHMELDDTKLLKCLAREYESQIRQIEQQAAVTGKPMDISASSEFIKLYGTAKYKPKGAIVNEAYQFNDRSLTLNEALQLYSHKVAKFFREQHDEARKDFSSQRSQTKDKVISALRDDRESCVSLRPKAGKSYVNARMAPESKSGNYACKTVSDGRTGWTAGESGDWRYVFMNNTDWENDCRGLAGAREIVLNDETPTRLATRGVWIHKSELEENRKNPDECMGEGFGEFDLEAKTEATVCLTCLASTHNDAFVQLAGIVKSGAVEESSKGLETVKINLDEVPDFCKTSTYQREFNALNKARHLAKGDSIAARESCKQFQARKARTSSPWQRKELDERIKLVTTTANEFIRHKKLGIDPRYMPCISARETHGYLEPLMSNGSMCASMGESSAQGLLAAVQLSSLKAVGGEGMHGRALPLPKFQRQELTIRGRQSGSESNGQLELVNLDLSPADSATQFHEVMGCFPDMQVWTGTMIFFRHITQSMSTSKVNSVTQSGGEFSDADMRNGLMKYYGGTASRQRNYRDHVMACVSCLKERVDTFGNLYYPDYKTGDRNDPANCLQRTLPGANRGGFNGQTLRTNFKSPTVGPFRSEEI